MIYVEEDSRVADQWLTELETNAAVLAELAKTGYGQTTRRDPEREEEVFVMHAHRI